MAEPRQTTAVVLRRVNFGDQDVIVTLLGRDTGKFAALARSARASKRRFGGGLQPMRVLRLNYTHQSNREMAFLRDIDVLDDFSGLEESLEKITLSAWATELVREVVQEAHPDPQTFDLLTAFYADLAAQPCTPRLLEAVLFQFELRLLELHGAFPDFRACFRCGAPAHSMDKLRCMKSGEGLVCQNCRRPGEAVGVVMEASLTLIDFLAEPAGDPPPSLGDPQTHEQIRRLLDASLGQLLVRPLKSRAMLETLFL